MKIQNETVELEPFEGYYSTIDAEEDFLNQMGSVEEFPTIVRETSLATETGIVSDSEAHDRRIWMGHYLTDLRKDGIIEAWSWAPNEQDFCQPMTKPALTKDQQVCMVADYLSYLELLESIRNKGNRQ